MTHNTYQSYYNSLTAIVMYQGQFAKTQYIASHPCNPNEVSQFSLMMYFTSLLSALEFCGVHMYPDDLKFEYSFAPEDISDAIGRVNRELATIENACIQHCSSLNNSKTSVILFSRQAILNEMVEQEKSVFIANGMFSLESN